MADGGVDVHRLDRVAAGDVDADWESAYNTGDEAPGGDMPTPDQAVVAEIGTAVGLEYADNEELKAVDKIVERIRDQIDLVVRPNRRPTTCARTIWTTWPGKGAG